MSGSIFDVVSIEDMIHHLEDEGYMIIGLKKHRPKDFEAFKNCITKEELRDLKEIVEVNSPIGAREEVE